MNNDMPPPQRSDDDPIVFVRNGKWFIKAGHEIGRAPKLKIEMAVKKDVKSPDDTSK